jgi:hypothetical protein
MRLALESWELPACSGERWAAKTAVRAGAMEKRQEWSGTSWLPYLEEYGTVLLVIAYGKKDQDDLSPDERKTIYNLVQRIEKQFSSGIIK